MKPTTEDEKKWFLIGYFTAQADSFAEEFGYSRKEAAEILLAEFERSRSYERKVTEE